MSRARPKGWTPPPVREEESTTPKDKDVDLAHHSDHADDGFDLDSTDDEDDEV